MATLLVIAANADVCHQVLGTDEGIKEDKDNWAVSSDGSTVVAWTA